MRGRNIPADPINTSLAFARAHRSHRGRNANVKDHVNLAGRDAAKATRSADPGLAEADVVTPDLCQGIVERMYCRLHPWLLADLSS
jgi:hypothetical protein